MLKKAKPINIFIDGSSLGNPGDAGIGVVMQLDNKPTLKLKKYIGKATNNVAEYSALIYSLEEARRLNLLNIKLHTDSELLHRQLIGKYKVRDLDLKELFSQAQGLLQYFTYVEITHIPREKNKEADNLAKQAAMEARGDCPDSSYASGRKVRAPEGNVIRNADGPI